MINRCKSGPRAVKLGLKNLGFLCKFTYRERGVTEDPTRHTMMCCYISRERNRRLKRLSTVEHRFSGRAAQKPSD